MNKERLLSLDVFRGITIAAMILVNDPGNWSYVYSPLLHAKWHGCTPTDLVFPFFLFMVGVAVSLSSPKEGETRRRLMVKILKRSLYLFLIGLFLNGFPNFEWSTLRIPGVLQRIALVFLVIGTLYHYCSLRTQVMIGAGLLVIYWILMTLVPVPGVGAPNLEPGTNLAAWFDRLFLTNHMWSHSKTWDPEGLLSTLPAMGTGWLGILTGRLLFSDEDQKGALIKLFVLANILIVVALTWDLFFPINKSLWTSSYVLYTGGLAIHFFCGLYWLLDVMKYRTVGIFPFQVFGSNAITVYTFSGILATLLNLILIDDVSLHQIIYNGINTIFDNLYFSSLVFALTFVIICYIPILILYRKDIFIKV